MAARGGPRCCRCGDRVRPPAVTPSPSTASPPRGAPKASHRSLCQPKELVPAAGTSPGHPAHRFLSPARRMSWSPRQSATLGGLAGGHRVYCGSSAYSRCRAGRASSPRWARAVPRARPGSAAGAAPRAPGLGSGCARTAPLGEPRPGGARAGRAGLVPMRPVPLRGRHHTGTDSPSLGQ